MREVLQTSDGSIFASHAVSSLVHTSSASVGSSDRFLKLQRIGNSEANGCILYIFQNWGRPKNDE